MAGQHNALRRAKGPSCLTEVEPGVIVNWSHFVDMGEPSDERQRADKSIDQDIGTYHLAPISDVGIVRRGMA